jgi:hypothetical protein
VSISVRFSFSKVSHSFSILPGLGVQPLLGKSTTMCPFFGGGFGDFAHVGRPNEYRPSGAVLSERGRYAALKGWLAVQIDAKLFIQFIQKGANNLCFIIFVEGGDFCRDRSDKGRGHEGPDPRVFIPAGRERGEVRKVNISALVYWVSTG